MVSINNYIQEKLYIGKGFKSYEALVEDIISMLKDIELRTSDIWDEVSKVVLEWVKKNDVSNVEYQVNEETFEKLKNEGRMTIKYFDKLKISNTNLKDKFSWEPLKEEWKSEDRKISISSNNSRLRYDSWMDYLYIVKV